MSKIPVDFVPAADANVEADIPCRKCGYNLRGLSLDGRCPECSTPVSVSTNGDLLCHSDPEFVRTLHRGVSFILWGFLPLLVTWIIITVFVRGRRDTPSLLLLTLVTALPGTIGSWFLTTPDPSGIGEDRYGTARKVFRIALAGEMLVQVIRLIAGIGNIAARVWIVLTALAFMVNMIKLVGIVALLIYLKKLAMRIPDPSLTRRANLLIWSYGIFYTVNIIVSVILLRLVYVLKTTALPFFFTNGFRIIFAIIMFILVLTYIFMIIRFGRHFKRQTDLAQKSWSVTSS